VVGATVVVVGGLVVVVVGASTVGGSGVVASSPPEHAARARAPTSAGTTAWRRDRTGGSTGRFTARDATHGEA